MTTPFDHIPDTVKMLETLAEQVRVAAERSGRRADADGAFELAQSAYHLKEAVRRLTVLRKELEAAAEAATKKQKKSWF